MKNKFTIGNFCIVTSGDWKDITDSADEGEIWPFTLAKDTGVGALQVSLVQYRSGKAPEIKLPDLSELRSRFASQRDYGEAFDEISLENPIIVSGGSYHDAGNYIRIWYCSNGMDVVLASYFSDWELRNGEEMECDAFVSSARFVNPPHPPL